MTQGGREMMTDRWRGILGRVDVGVAPGQGYQDFSSFRILVSGFPLTYRDELIDEVSDGRRECFTLYGVQWRTRTINPITTTVQSGNSHHASRRLTRAPLAKQPKSKRESR
jgi:hypothetical protein